MYKNTLAHRTLPFGTKVRLVNLENGKSAEGVVDDRGPYVKDRDVDVSYGMARQLGFVKGGSWSSTWKRYRCLGESIKGLGGAGLWNRRKSDNQTKKIES